MSEASLAISNRAALNPKRSAVYITNSFGRTPGHMQLLTSSFITGK